MSEERGTAFDVVIAGGSYAGLAIARGLSLALSGAARIAIVERAPKSAEPVQDGRAFAIWAAAKTGLESLGVWDEIAADAHPMSSIEISDSALSDGVRPTLLTYEGSTSDGASAAYVVPAARLHAALLAAVRDDVSISWIAPAEGVALTQHPHNIEVGLRDGRALTSGLCVAADGRNSRLRDAAGVKSVGWPYEQRGIVANVEFEVPHGGVAIQHFLPGGPFAILPMGDNRACITWSAQRDEAERVLALDDEAFAAELDARIGGRFGTISVVGSRQSWPLDVKLPRALIAPRFALAGDAAHGVHPIAGQGVNLALRDAAALVECIVDAVRLGFDFGHNPALERYQRWRRFDATMSASLYDALNRMFGIDNSVLRAGRGAGLAVLDRLPQLKQIIVDEAAGVTGELPKLLRGEPV